MSSRDEQHDRLAELLAEINAECEESSDTEEPRRGPSESSFELMTPGQHSSASSIYENEPEMSSDGMVSSAMEQSVALSPEQSHSSTRLVGSPAASARGSEQADSPALGSLRQQDGCAGPQPMHSGEIAKPTISTHPGTTVGESASSDAAEAGETYEVVAPPRSVSEFNSKEEDRETARTSQIQSSARGQTLSSGTAKPKDDSAKEIIADDPRGTDAQDGITEPQRAGAKPQQSHSDESEDEEPTVDTDKALLASSGASTPTEKDESRPGRAKPEALKETAANQAEVRQDVSIQDPSKQEIISPEAGSATENLVEESTPPADLIQKNPPTDSKECDISSSADPEQEDSSVNDTKKKSLSSSSKQKDSAVVKDSKPEEPQLSTDSGQENSLSTNSKHEVPLSTDLKQENSKEKGPTQVEPSSSRDGIESSTVASTPRDREIELTDISIGPEVLDVSPGHNSDAELNVDVQPSAQPKIESEVEPDVGPDVDPDVGPAADARSSRIISDEAVEEHGAALTGGPVLAPVIDSEPEVASINPATNVAHHTAEESDDSTVSSKSQLGASEGNVLNSPVSNKARTSGATTTDSTPVTTTSAMSEAEFERIEAKLVGTDPGPGSESSTQASLLDAASPQGAPGGRSVSSESSDHGSPRASEESNVSNETEPSLQHLSASSDGSLKDDSSRLDEKIHLDPTSTQDSALVSAQTRKASTSRNTGSTISPLGDSKPDVAAPLQLRGSEASKEASQNVENGISKPTKESVKEAPKTVDSGSRKDETNYPDPAQNEFEPGLQETQVSRPESGVQETHSQAPRPASSQSKEPQHEEEVRSQREAEEAENKASAPTTDKPALAGSGFEETSSEILKDERAVPEVSELDAGVPDPEALNAEPDGSENFSGEFKPAHQRGHSKSKSLEHRNSQLEESDTGELAITSRDPTKADVGKRQLDTNDQPAADILKGSEIESGNSSLPMVEATENPHEPESPANVEPVIPDLSDPVAPEDSESPDEVAKQDDTNQVPSSQAFEDVQSKQEPLAKLTTSEESITADNASGVSKIAEKTQGSGPVNARQIDTVHSSASSDEPQANVPSNESNIVYLYMSFASGVRGTMSRYNRAVSILDSYDIKFVPVEITMDERARRLWKYKGANKNKVLPAIFRDGDLKCDYNELLEANEYEDVEGTIFDGL